MRSVGPVADGGFPGCIAPMVVGRKAIEGGRSMYGRDCCDARLQCFAALTLAGLNSINNSLRDNVHEEPGMTETSNIVSSLREGEQGIVYSVAGGKALSSRLAGMGISPGVKLKVLRRIGGSVIVLASGTRVALGMGQAEKILVTRVTVEAESEAEGPQEKPLLVALAGQPNVGKSTVFNVLTGLSQHVGNWPGKTVEKKEGVHSHGDAQIRIVDLPGTYSLSAFSEEERVARAFIIHERPDVVVLIVDASALERSLYLLSELVLLGSPIVLGVNMIDVAEDQGIKVDVDALGRALGVPVVSMTATKNRGIKEVVERVLDVAEGRIIPSPRAPSVSSDHREIYERITELIRDHVPPLDTEAWITTKLMEGDPEITGEMEKLLPPGRWSEIQSLLIKHEDALRAVVGGRYDWIEEATRASVSRFKRGQVLMTDRIDHLLTRPVIGIPVLLGILAFVFLVTYEVGFPIQELLERLVSLFGSMVEGNLSALPRWVRGLVVDGVIGGAGSVITFVPILAIFFTAMAFLENVGYMARAAFVMDKFMHVIGLHGKSFLPMCLGFGCNVASVMGARIVESRRARLLTIFLTPFVPCTGRLATLTFITAAIFGGKALLITWSLVTANILALGLAGIAISRTFFRHESVPFIMELPLYHRPDLKVILSSVWNRTLAFVKKAGTVILVFSIVLWIVAYVPHGTVDTSILSWFGRTLEPLGAVMGLSWKMIVALLASIVAKENSVATLGILYAVGEQGLGNVLPNVIPPASALAFLVVLMVFIPCVPTIAIMRREMDDWRWFTFSLLFMLGVSAVGGISAFHLGLWLHL
jgi:ferrous iron transport protein B